jgi:hypothetical protein
MLNYLFTYSVNPNYLGGKKKSISKFQLRVTQSLFFKKINVKICKYNNNNNNLLFRVGWKENELNFSYNRSDNGHFCNI